MTSLIDYAIVLSFHVSQKAGNGLIQFSIIMQNKIFVGGLPWAIDNERLAEVFGQYGEVKDAYVALERETKRSRGFGFVEFATDEAAQAAIDAMDGQDLDGRTITVNIAQPRDN